jgi:hypothetical protein
VFGLLDLVKNLEIGTISSEKNSLQIIIKTTFFINLIRAFDWCMNCDIWSKKKFRLFR